MASKIKVDTLETANGTGSITFNNPISGFTSTGIDDNATSVAITIDASEQVGINTTSPAKPLDVTGDIRTSTGILFGTDTAAANTLDDYEEGNFCPILRGSTSAGSFSTNSAHEGLYTKIGDVCTVNFRIAGTLSGATGSYTHFDLPFTVKAGSWATGSFSYVDTPNLSHLDFSSYVNAGQTLGYFIIKTVSATTPAYPAPSSFMPDSVQLYGTITYQVA